MGVGQPLGKDESGQQPQGGSQEHLNEVPITRLGRGRAAVPATVLWNLRVGNGKSPQLGGLHYQSTVVREEKPHSGHLTGSLDSFLIPQGNGL